MKGGPSFAERVYGALCEVPAGRVTTYAALARRVGVASPRAVGQALKRNPDAPRVPCHRVIGADLRPGGYSGRREGAEWRRKLELLEAEGVGFGPDGRLAEPWRLWAWDDNAAARP